MRFLTSYLMLLFVVALFGCKAEKGDTGLTGPSGSPGNANISNATFQVSSSQWINIGTQGGTQPNYRYSKYIPQLTKHISDSGLVVTYIQTSQGWISLPTTLWLGSLSYIDYGYYYKTDTLNISRVGTDTTTRVFRVVLADSK